MKFSTLALSNDMLKNLEKIGYELLTPIQKEALPYILNKEDILAKAKTGSGKTAAFGIGILENLDIKKFKIQSLILTPTRELAYQVADELRLLAKFKHNIKITTICGAESYFKQVNSLKHNAHIVVATPRRLLKHLHNKTLNLDELKSVVLDEADRMLDMGFIDDVSEILDFTPVNKQVMLFSATYNDEVLTLSQKLQNNPKVVQVEQKSNNIVEKFYKVDNKDEALVDLFAKYDPKNTIVFCNTKVKCDDVAQFLQAKGIDALALHGDLEQYQRVDVLTQFSNYSCRVLVATDVASRGLDIKDLELVINYDLAQTEDIYTHRIGRSARAGSSGMAITLYKKDEDIADKTDIVFEKDVKKVDSFLMKPKFCTLVIEGGKKDKLRKGDIVGALTSTKELKAEDIGIINLQKEQTYVAIVLNKIDLAKDILQNGLIKTKKYSVWILS